MKNKFAILILLSIIAINVYGSIVQRLSQPPAADNIEPREIPSDMWDVRPMIFYDGHVYMASNDRIDIDVKSLNEIGKIQGLVPPARTPWKELESNSAELGQPVYSNGEEGILFMKLNGSLWRYDLFN